VGELLTPAQFARVKGVSRQTVSSAMDSRLAAAIVTKAGRRLIDRSLGLELWDRNTRRNNNAKISEGGREADRRPADVPRSAAASMPTAEAAAVVAAVMALPDDRIPGRDISEERKLHYQAELAKVQALQAREEVASVEQMKQEAFTLARAVRDGLLAIVPRVSADVAALSNTFEIEQLLERELMTALRMLADG